MLLFLALMPVALVSATLPKNYQSQSATSKQDLLWNQITFTKYKTLPGVELSFFQKARLLIPTHYPPTFDDVSDEFLNGREKLIHPYGVCAKATFAISPTSPYSGVFKAGVQNPIIVRPSTALWAPPLLAPGMGIKVLIDGQPSQNFVMLYRTEGQPGDNNFLANNISTSFVQTDHGLLSKAFAAGLLLLSGGAESRPESPSTLGLIQAASVESSGKTVPKAQANAPWKLDFVPNPDPTMQVAKDSTVDFRTKLSTFPVGTTLYTVVAYKYEEDWDARRGDVLGSVVLTTPLVAADYCDNTLFLQHSRMPNPPKPKDL